jgi:protein SCO1/2
MMRGRAAAWLVSVVTCISVASAAAAPASSVIDPKAAIADSQRVVGRTVGDYRFVDTTGAPLALRDYRGKPLVISLVYSACSSICPPTTQHLIDAVNEAGRVFGPDRFAVLTIGFDARNDTVARMAQFATMQGIRSPNWRVASGDAGSIEALLKDLGFSYRAVAGGFDHPAQTTILDSEGKIYRHVYGDDFPFTMFMEPMKDVVYGTRTPFSLDGIIDRIRFICTAYDPGSRRYRFDYGLVFGGAIAGFSLLAMGGLIFREWMRSAQA